MTGLEKKIGYAFKDPSLLETALTHSSYVNEHGLRKQDCNERMEFFGDAILEEFSSAYLYREYPLMMEGELSKMRASLVCEKSLAEAARTLELGKILKLGRGMELGGGREYDSLLSDAFESLLAALVLDGGREVAKELVHTLVMKREPDAALSDPKTALQELVQQKGGSVEYVLVEESGPEHDKHYRYQVKIRDKAYAIGEGRSKKAAQMQAAEKTINMIKESRCI